jgi:hypothetical protein
MSANRLYSGQETKSLTVRREKAGVFPPMSNCCPLVLKLLYVSER